MSGPLLRTLIFGFVFILIAQFTWSSVSRKEYDPPSQTVPRGDLEAVTVTTAGADSNNFAVYTKEQQYLFDIFKSRRSVRRFKLIPIPDDHIRTMIDIARSAPTSGNQQPWKFLIIQDRKKLQQLQEKCLKAVIRNAKIRGDTNAVSLDSMRQRRSRFYNNYLTAPLYIVVLTDSNSTYPSYNIYDGTLAAENLMIAARALGYGSVFTTDVFPDEIIKEVFEIPDNFKQICFMPIGIPEEWPVSPKKKPLDDFIVFEKFVEGMNYTAPPKRIAIPLDQRSISRVVGKYDNGSGTIIIISRENDRVFVQVPGQEKYEMFAESETKFFLKSINAQIQFFTDNEGVITSLTIFQGEGKFPAKKIE
jgi:nitroreductase